MLDVVKPVVQRVTRRRTIPAPCYCAQSKGSETIFVARCDRWLKRIRTQRGSYIARGVQYVGKSRK